MRNVPCGRFPPAVPQEFTMIQYRLVGSVSSYPTQTTTCPSLAVPPYLDGSQTAVSPWFHQKALKSVQAAPSGSQKSIGTACPL